MIENLDCPICGGKMISRANKTTGQRFWGCATFPKCKGTRNTDGEVPPPREYRPTPIRETDDLDESPSARARRQDRGRWRV